MRARAQLRWAIVSTHNGHIKHETSAYSRGQVIRTAVAERRRFHLKYPNMFPGEHALTDAQLWRLMKRKRLWSVRRISMRVAS